MKPQHGLSRAVMMKNNLKKVPKRLGTEHY
jgi:hypothetical protein